MNFYVTLSSRGTYNLSSHQVYKRFTFLSVTASPEFEPPPQEENVMTQFPWTCDFGNRVFHDCRFSQDSGFALQWQSNLGPTPTANTGTAETTRSIHPPLFPTLFPQSKYMAHKYLLRSVQPPQLDVWFRVYN